MMNNGGANTCMTGAPPPDDEIAEAREPAPGVMQAYFDAAQNGGSLSSAFRESSKSSWSHSEITVPYEQIDAQSDPLAIAGNQLDPDPLRFFRAGSFETALGQWSVLDAAGSVAGVYDAEFKRQRGEWKLHKLSVVGAETAIAPAMQYCWEPGDVTEQRVVSAKDRIEHLERQIVKSEGKLVRDQERLDKAEAKLAVKPDRKSNQESAQRARERVAKREEKLSDLRESLADAQEALMKSERDVAEIAAMTVPAREALRFRDFELTTEKEEAEEKAAEEAEAAAE